jgi:uncharacterized protein YndB with AHSA1/START domain
MTGPDGEKAPGWWEFITVDAPASLSFIDGFANEDGSPDPQMPDSRTSITIEPIADGSRMTMVSRFADAAQMRQLVEMGMVEGMTAALGQIDGILAEG